MKPVEVQSRMVVAKKWRDTVVEEIRSQDTKFQLGRLSKFWRSKVQYGDYN